MLVICTSHAGQWTLEVPIEADPRSSLEGNDRWSVAVRKRVFECQPGPGPGHDAPNAKRRDPKRDAKATEVGAEVILREEDDGRRFEVVMNGWQVVPKDEGKRACELKGEVDVGVRVIPLKQGIAAELDSREKRSPLVESPTEEESTGSACTDV